jgi:hypothetical protein
MSETNFIKDNQIDFLKHFKKKFPAYHLSNIFLRDFHYGVITFFIERGKNIKHSEAERIAKEVILFFENQNLLKRVDHKTWLLNYPAFALPKKEKKAS